MKLVKWSLSLLRIVFLKLKFGKRLIIENSLTLKPTYIGSKCRFYIEKDSKVVIGQGAYLTGNVEISAMEGAKINIGKRVFVGRDCFLIARKGISIGKYSLLAPGTSIYDHNHIYNLDVPVAEQGFSSESVVIGNNSWLGKNSVVTKGVKCYGQLILGANAVLVKKNIEDEHSGGVYVGNPAIKK